MKCILSPYLYNLADQSARDAWSDKVANITLEMCKISDIISRSEIFIKPSTASGPPPLSGRMQEIEIEMVGIRSKIAVLIDMDQRDF